MGYPYELFVSDLRRLPMACKSAAERADVTKIAAGALRPWMDLWDLRPDGPAFSTHHAQLMPVRQNGRPAMLKLTAQPDEIRGARVMTWWNGEGAAPVLAQQDGALLLARATGTGSLADMARRDQDDLASRIICKTGQALHRSRPNPPDLVPLPIWFRELEPAAATHGGLLGTAWETARKLLGDMRDPCPLHGDLHHENILDFGAEGWLAIDPQGLWGERGFDFANIFTNPDLSDPTRPVATRPGVFARRLDVISTAADLDRQRLVEWVLAWSGLSAAWFIADDDPMAEIDLHIASLAAAELARLAPGGA